MGESNYCEEYIVSRDFLAKHKRERYDLKGDEVIFSSGPYVTFEDIYNHAVPVVHGEQWISVKDRLPSDDNKDWVLAVITEKNGYQWMPTRGEYRKGLDDWYFEETGWLRNHNGAFNVTHWMPLPEAPKENDDAEET